MPLNWQAEALALEFARLCLYLSRHIENSISMKNGVSHEGSEVLFWYVSGFLGRLMTWFAGDL